MRSLSYWLKLLLPLTFLCLLLIAGISWLVNQPVKQVKVFGRVEHLNLQQLEKTAAPWLEQSFWRLDLKGLKASLEQDPWLAEVNITRRWPNSLHLKLTERQAWAYLNDKMLIDTQGKSFQPKELPPLKLSQHLHVQPERLAEAVKFWQDSAILLQASQLTLTQLTFTPRGSWQLEVNSAIKIYLGTHLLEERLQNFLTAWQGWLAKDANKIASIDLRYPNGLAVAWLNSAAN